MSPQVCRTVFWFCLLGIVSSLECYTGPSKQSFSSRDATVLERIECGGHQNMSFERGGKAETIVINSTFTAKQCIITDYTLFDSENELITKTEYSCDVTGHCKNWTGSQNSMFYKELGHWATMHCCDKDLCNTMEIGSKMSTPSIQCFQGIRNSSISATSIRTSPCNSNICANITTIVKGDLLEIFYGCDMDNKCNGLTHDECREISPINLTVVAQQLCCCKENQCNVPDARVQFPRIPVHSDRVSHITWSTVISLLAAIILLCFLVVIAVVAVRKYRQMRLLNPNQDFAYRDLAEEFTNEQMPPVYNIYHPTETPTDTPEPNFERHGNSDDTLLLP